MTFFAPDPVPSGMPYDIVAVDGDRPSALEQFVGETMFTIAKGECESEIRGLGTTDDAGVHFQEKAVTLGGKDVRTWHISQAAGGEFTASATAAF